MRRFLFADFREESMKLSKQRMRISFTLRFFSPFRRRQDGASGVKGDKKQNISLAEKSQSQDCDFPVKCFRSWIISFFGEQPNMRL